MKLIDISVKKLNFFDNECTNHGKVGRKYNENNNEIKMKKDSPEMFSHLNTRYYINCVPGIKIESDTKKKKHNISSSEIFKDIMIIIFFLAG